MANMADIKRARAALLNTNKSMVRAIIYGGPSVGKTFLAASVALVPHIKRVFWFDLENGSDTIYNADRKLTDAQLGKIELYKIPDTMSNPVAHDTLLKCLGNTKGVAICTAHGKVNCVRCKSLPGDANDVFPPIAELGPEDCIVIDSLTQLTDSNLVVGTQVAARLEKANAHAKYSEQGNMLNELLGVIQQLNTNIVCITHQAVLEDPNTKQTSVVPLIGTANYSRSKGAKFFSTKLHMAVDMKTYKMCTNPLGRLNTLAGSRGGENLSAAAGDTLVQLFT